MSGPELRYCGYCKSWNDKPCGNGCVWTPDMPAFSEMQMNGPELLWQELLEKDDRTSPAEYPDMALITFDEFCDFLRRAAPQPAPAVGEWRDMSSAPKDGTHILAKLHREAIEDMDGIRRKDFAEIREIWYRPYPCPIFGHDMPWHAGDPFDSHDGMAPDHMGENVPIAWMPVPEERA